VRTSTRARVQLFEIALAARQRYDNLREDAAMTPATSMALLSDGLGARAEHPTGSHLPASVPGAATHRGAPGSVGTGGELPSRHVVVWLDADSVGTTYVLIPESGWPA
jgi:hypothetical protein